MSFTLDGGAPFQTVLANLNRPDLVAAHVAPNPEHGFGFDIPAAIQERLLSGDHTLAALVNGVALPSGCAKVGCSVPGPPPSPPPVVDKYAYIQNSEVKLGADLTRGGSIGYFSSLTAPHPDSRLNVVNCHDMGREIQLSFYMLPIP